MLVTLVNEMHPGAVAAPFSRNVADAGSLSEFDAGRCSVYLSQEPLLCEDGQGFTVEMTSNFKFICKHLLKLYHSAWYRATHSKKEDERVGCSAGSDPFPLLNWTITRRKAKQQKRLTSTPKTKGAYHGPVISMIKSD